MNDDEQNQSEDREDQNQEQDFQWVTATIGVIIIGFGLSGLLDDTGLLTHPWWIMVFVSLALVFVLIMRRALNTMSER